MWKKKYFMLVKMFWKMLKHASVFKCLVDSSRKVQQLDLESQIMNKSMKKKQKEESYDLSFSVVILQHTWASRHLVDFWSKKGTVGLALEIKIKHESMAEQTLKGNISTLLSSIGASCFLLHFFYK